MDVCRELLDVCKRACTGECACVFVYVNASHAHAYVCVAVQVCIFMHMNMRMFVCACGSLGVLVHAAQSRHSAWLCRSHAVCGAECKWVCMLAALVVGVTVCVYSCAVHAHACPVKTACTKRTAASMIGICLEFIISF